MSEDEMKGYERLLDAIDELPPGQTAEKAHTALTGPERQALGCDCWRVDDDWHHRRDCPVPAVEKMLGERVEGNDRMHRALSQAKDRYALTLEGRLAQIRSLVTSAEAVQYRDEACRHAVAQPYADNRYVRLLDDVRAVVSPPGVTK